MKILIVCFHQMSHTQKDRQVVKYQLLLLLASNFGGLNSTAQKEIYQEYYKMVYGPIAYMVKDHALTEDIIQAAFLKSDYQKTLN